MSFGMRGEWTCAVIFHPKVGRDTEGVVRTGRSTFTSECLMVMVVCWCCKQSGCSVDRSLGMSVEAIVEWVRAVIFHLNVSREIGGVGRNVVWKTKM